ncbi:glycosyltransferase family 4 protein [Quisquiliibacterium transsilvanicum]|uniref:Glycosyltransferase involved in cell wall biosynthesis n=1 Tax=Quisquiliibacterium transsilvanicum TaxID=1549638 RepID=A0A7W8HKK3_9BURK|nr:glycosyltransferase family 4 protein [Quisquiliibacterium transsilvanicum]MBB5273678.1 glycosyltransferase involved in cell wall biosynthesis [Quisquiliibacterium transsilvanicum]
MKILFVHQNFPGQFLHLAPALAARGHEVGVLTMRTGLPKVWQGVRIATYRVQRGSTQGIHPWLVDLESKVIRGEAAFRAALAMRKAGYEPDVVIAHPGWGESLFLKDVWPRARLGIYCEFHYRASGADVGFDPEFPATDPGDPCRIRLKGVNNLLHFQAADAGLSPTRWQADSFPDAFRPRISVMHDGIDTDRVAPDPSAFFELAEAEAPLRLVPGDEIITFVNRNLEPYRGYHVFMRMLPEILRRRPGARVVIVGGDGLSYGAPAPGGRSWKDVFLDEVRARIDPARVHFTGRLPYERYLALLRVSAVHVYLTYPFVLGWSLLEAMSAGCAIVASDTPPVREAIVHGETGRMAGFLDVAALADEVCGLLEDPGARVRLGAAAREHARRHYDLRTVCLPGQVAWAESVADARD